MPMRKKYYRKKRKNNNKGQKKLLKLLKRVQPETKYLDVFNAGVRPDFDGLTFNLLAITGGTDQSQRVADIIFIKGLLIRYTLEGNNVAGSKATGRIIFTSWFNDVLPTPANILQSTGSAITALSPYNFENGGRFHIYYDQLHSQEGQGANSSVLSRKKYIRINKKMKYAASVSTVPQNEQIALIVSSDQAAMANDRPTLRIHVRVLYTDA